VNAALASAVKRRTMPLEFAKFEFLREMRDDPDVDEIIEACDKPPAGTFPELEVFVPARFHMAARAGDVWYVLASGPAPYEGVHIWARYGTLGA